MLRSKRSRHVSVRAGGPVEVGYLTGDRAASQRFRDAVRRLAGRRADLLPHAALAMWVEARVRETAAVARKPR